MGLFNLIETFFYLSLGVCFVLILLLVYHFKQRILTLEKKSDTMVDIISNVVKEVSNLKNSNTNTRPPAMFEFFENPLHNQEPPMTSMPFPEMSFFMHSSKPSPSVSSLVEELDITEIKPERVEVSDVESDEDSGEDTDDRSSASTTSDTDDESDADDLDETERTFRHQEQEEEETNDYLLDEEIHDIPMESKEEDSTIRIVNLPLNQTIQSESFDLVEEIETETEGDDDRLVEIETASLGVNRVDGKETETLIVNKLDETVLSEVEMSIPSETSIVNEKLEKQESYRKMNVQQLKALVISNGLSTNTSKLNKTELIKLLLDE
jgi:hypothetical protein